MRGIDLKVGFSCNNDCIHCVAADKRSFGNLSLHEIKREIDFHKTDEESILIITGGEPTIRKELPDIIQYAKAANIEWIELQTNGRRLKDAELVQRLREAGLTSSLVALHSHNSKVHDSITQREGSLSETIAGINNLIDNGVEVRTNTVISRLNVDHLDKLASFMVEEIPGLSAAQLTFPHPNGNAYRNFDWVVPRLTESYQKIIAAIKIALRGDLWIMVEAVPFCFLPGFERHSIDIEHLERVVGTDLGSGVEDGRILDYRLLLKSDKRKSRRCRECCLDPICEGVWKEYAEKYSTDELTPVEGLDPAYILGG